MTNVVGYKPKFCALSAEDEAFIASGNKLTQTSVMKAWPDPFPDNHRLHHQARQGHAGRPDEQRTSSGAPGARALRIKQLPHLRSREDVGCPDIDIS